MVAKQKDKQVMNLHAEDFEKVAKAEDVLVFDTRAPQVFKDAFIPNSINLGIDGPFDLWASQLILDPKQSIVIIAEVGREKEVIKRLAKGGYDNVIGYLEGGIHTWQAANKALDQITSISPKEYRSRFEKGGIDSIDVRKPSEFDLERLIGVGNYPLNTFDQEIIKLDIDKEYHIFCGGGYRSMITASILKSKGFDQVIDVAGGFKAIKETGIKTS